MINTFHTRNLYKREYSLKKKFKNLFKKIILFFLDLYKMMVKNLSYNYNSFTSHGKIKKIKKYYFKILYIL